MFQTMPHLQDDTIKGKHRKEAVAGSMHRIDSPSSRAEELPIQVATPNYLGTSDPVVAMANKVSIAIVESSFESVEKNESQHLSSPSSHRITKTVITSSSRIGSINTGSSNSSTTDDVSNTDAESIYSRKKCAGPMVTAVCSSSHLSHSPILVKRRVSQSEDEEPSISSTQQPQLKNAVRGSTLLDYEESNLSLKSTRPALIRRGSSLVLGDQTTNVVSPSQEDLSNTKLRKVKPEGKNDGASSDRAICGTSPMCNTSTVEAVAAASTMADMRNTKALVSPTTSEEKGEGAANGTQRTLAVGHHSHHTLQQTYHPNAPTPHTYHPHAIPYGGHPFCPTGGYPMVYPGYPPRFAPSNGTPVMPGQFHRHPATGFYAPYHPEFHAYPISQHGGQQTPVFVPPYGPMTGSVLSASKSSSNKHCTKTEAKDEKNGMAVVNTMYNIPACSTLDHGANCASISNSGAVGKSMPANRCIPLQEPIPSKHWGKIETTESAVLPDFHRLVNYPDYLSKSRSLGSGESGASGGPKVIEGKKHCVMCGKLRICSASSLVEKGRAAISGDDGTAHIIPRQNKGLCTACDVTVWVLVDSGLEIKWCKGCKNFRQWAAFGEKGSATKCLRCRQRQREKYAMQKNAKRARRTKDGIAEKSLAGDLASSLLPSPSSSSQHHSSIDEKDETHFAAARGLTSLMNAAATL